MKRLLEVLLFKLFIIELYDLQNDPMEMNNLIRNPEYSEIAAGMRQELFHWLEETGGDVMYLKNDSKSPRFDYRYKQTY